MKIMQVFTFLRTLLELIRLRNAVMSVFGVFIGAVLLNVGSPIDYGAVSFATISAALILGGGNTLNDYFDYEIDKVNKPSRPIPSGRISRSDAFILSLVMFLLGLGFSKAINNFCLGIAIFNTIVLIAYAKYSKKMLLLANISISYLVASIFVYGACSVYEKGQWINPSGIMLVSVVTICSFLINLSREIVKDIEDVKGDAKAYSKTLPLVIGVEKSKRIALFFTLAAIVFSYTPVFNPTTGFNELIYVILITATNVILLSAYRMAAAASQQLIVLGMGMALLSFFLGIIRQFLVFA